MSEHVNLGGLEIYRLAITISNRAWTNYEKFDWQIKKIIGDQFITAIDSIGANIAEGYGRFHFLDRIKFYYNSRGSLIEAKHWTFLLKTRNVIDAKEAEKLLADLENLHKILNIYIKSCYETKNNSR